MSHTSTCVSVMLRSCMLRDISSSVHIDMLRLRSFGFKSLSLNRFRSRGRESSVTLTNLISDDDKDEIPFVYPSP